MDGETAIKFGYAQHITESGNALAKCVDVIEGYLGTSIPEGAHKKALSLSISDPQAFENLSESEIESKLLEADETITIPSTDEFNSAMSRAAWLHFQSSLPVKAVEENYKGNSLESIKALKSAVISACDASKSENNLVERNGFLKCWGSPQNMKALRQSLKIHHHSV
jgi:hypothetical protein